MAIKTKAGVIVHISSINVYYHLLNLQILILLNCCKLIQVQGHKVTKQQKPLANPYLLQLSVGPCNSSGSYLIKSALEETPPLMTILSLGCIHKGPYGLVVIVRVRHPLLLSTYPNYPNLGMLKCSLPSYDSPPPPPQTYWVLQHQGRGEGTQSVGQQSQNGIRRGL